MDPYQAPNPSGAPQPLYSEQAPNPSQPTYGAPPNPSQPMYGAPPPSQPYSQPMYYQQQPPTGQQPPPGALADPHIAIPIGAAVGVVATFLPWYTVTASATSITSSYSVSVNAWGYWPGIIFGIAALLALGLYGARKLNILMNPLPDLNIYLGLGVAAAIGGLLYLITPASASYGNSYSFLGVQVSYGPSYGLFLGLLGAAGLLFGAFTMRKQATTP